MNIKDLKSGDHLEGCQFLVDEVRVCVSNAGKQYYNMTLQDSSGKLDAKKWDIVAGDENIFVAGNVVSFRGDVNLYNNGLQLKVLSGNVVPSEQIDITKFVQSAPETEKSLEEELDSFISSIEDHDLRLIVSSLVEDNKNAFLTYPAAARNHHAYANGLLYHSVSMTRLANAICNLYPLLNRDLVISGTLLHDLGKIKELSGVVATQYTIEGKLVGHLVIATEMIDKKANELGLQSEQILLLKHMMLSHHGKLEYGAAKLPETKEALALAMIDDFDAKMEILRIAYKDVKPGEWTSRILALDGRTFYNSYFQINRTKAT